MKCVLHQGKVFIKCLIILLEGGSPLNIFAGLIKIQLNIRFKDRKK